MIPADSIKIESLGNDAFIRFTSMHLIPPPPKSVALKIILFSFINNLSLTHIEFAERGSFFFQMKMNCVIFCLL